MTYKDKKEYMKAWRQAHREEIKSYNRAHKEYKKAWRQAHMEEHKAYMKAWRQAHREELKAKNKAYYKAHREELKSYNRAHREEQKAYQKAWRQAHREDMKAYHKSDTNSLGQTKNSIRTKSIRYLFNVLKHTKIKGYEIHHCFGYNDYRNFIYIPSELHLQIHQFLRDNEIDADSDHYSRIEHLIVNYLKLNNRHVLIMHNTED